jgi:hypothetical protein
MGSEIVRKSKAKPDKPPGGGGGGGGGPIDPPIEPPLVPTDNLVLHAEQLVPPPESGDYLVILGLKAGL